MSHGDRKIGTAKTTITYSNQDETFELMSEMNDTELAEVPILHYWLYLTTAKNRYVITRNGELRSISAEGDIRLEAKQRSDRLVQGVPLLTAHTEFRGRVVDGKLEREVVLESPVGIVKPRLEPTEAPSGNILNPLHPVSRIKVTPGRRWRMPVIDPMAAAVEPTIQAAWQDVNKGGKPLNLRLPASPKYLDAEVLTKTVRHPWNGRDHECYVIEYHVPGEEQSARTYVRVRDGLVLKQEAFAMGERFTLERDNFRNSFP
jgi:hypothetical protein